MMNKRITALCLLALSTVVFADSIDDAEAKKRGVPVSQVQVERALAEQKQKNADLQQQIIELEKKIADAKGSTAAASGLTKTSDASSGSSSPMALAPAMATGDPPGTGLNFDGPRDSSPLYDDFVNRYLAGDCDKLAADMAAKQKEIAALPAGNAADLTYVQQVLAESRPAWWDKSKAGKTLSFKQLVWKQEINATYQPGRQTAFVKTTLNNGTTLPTFAWAAEDVDGQAPIASMGKSFNLNIPGDNGFLRRDELDFEIWTMLGSASLLVEVGADKVKALPPDQTKQLQFYQEFRQNVTAGYYGTPPARRAVCVRSVACLSPLMQGNPSWAGVQPLGVAILLELAGHAELYKSIALDPKSFIPNIMEGGPTPEMMLSNGLVLKVLNARLTLDEDRHMRDMIRAVADANLTWTSDMVSLPNNLRWSVNRSQDGPMAKERADYFAAHIKR